MKIIEHKDIKTIDDYKTYQKQRHAIWYEKNKEKRKEQMRKYSQAYYAAKKEAKSS